MCLAAAWLAAPPMLSGGIAAACPFCTAIEPTWCQRRAAADITLLAEVEQQTDDRVTRMHVHRVLEGHKLVGDRAEFDLRLGLAARPGTLLLLAGDGRDEAALDQMTWHAVPVDELSYAYFARAPSIEIAAAERLKYFAPFLEHANPLIAEDAYLEFGHASFDDVAQVAPTLPMAQVREWLSDPNVPGQRKGFYGLVLGLADDPHQRQANARWLRQLILKPADDFRAGFDGILGGHLLLTGTEGLPLIEERYLSNPRAADGDVRHALSAMRFYHEHGREIPLARLQAAVRHLLARPEFAETAATDLARWNDWKVVDEIAALYERPEYAQAATRRAIIGYLLACPEPQAIDALKRLRAIDPAGVAAAEQVLWQTGSVPGDR